MRTLGYISAVVLTAASAGLGVLVVMGIPDLRRYLKIRKM